MPTCRDACRHPASSLSAIDAAVLCGLPHPLCGHPRLLDVVLVHRCAAVRAASADQKRRRRCRVPCVRAPACTLLPLGVQADRSPPGCPAVCRSYAWGALMINQFGGDRDVEVRGWVHSAPAWGAALACWLVAAQLGSPPNHQPTNLSAVGRRPEHPGRVLPGHTTHPA